MDIPEVIIKTIKNNTILLITCLVLAGSGGVVHYLFQNSKYISSFEVSKGAIGYSLFKSANDLNTINDELYGFPADTLESLREKTEDFHITTKDKSERVIQINLVANKKDADHIKTQNIVLKLINHNTIIKNSLTRNLVLLNKKIDFLKATITKLDSLILNPPVNSSISEIPYYTYSLYSEQLELEAQLEILGNFKLIKPVTTILENKRPLVMFLVLYLVLFSFVFLIFSKKKS